MIHDLEHTLRRNAVSFCKIANGFAKLITLSNLLVTLRNGQSRRKVLIVVAEKQDKLFCTVQAAKQKVRLVG